MDYLKNHCWCSNSHWNGEHFDCKIIVSFKSYDDYSKEDWDIIMAKKEVYSDVEYQRNKDIFADSGYTPEKLETMCKMMAAKKIPMLKPEVMAWLNENVLDDKHGNKMWCVGSDEYTFNDSCSSYCVFFQRTRDAMKFIKTWSKWKKPVYYTQYFTDVRKVLDLETMKYNFR